MRKKMIAGIRRHTATLKIRFRDLSWESAWQTKRQDGRRYMYFYDENGRHRTIYRYQWVWIVEHGPIPKGHHIHHRNLNCTEDRLANLQMLTKREHQAIHPLSPTKSKRMVEARGDVYIGGAPTWTCQRCGKKFNMYEREGKPRKYCSRACLSSARSSTI